LDFIFNFLYGNLFIDERQADLDNWIRYYNEERTHSGKYCFGKTPMETFLDTLPLTKEKNWTIAYRQLFHVGQLAAGADTTNRETSRAHRNMNLAVSL
jgi:hypothetical protein